MKNIDRKLWKPIFIRLFGEIRWYKFLLAIDYLDQDGYDTRLIELVMKKALSANSVCVDVGCHRGNLLAEMLKNAPRGEFFAFEPLPFLYLKLVTSFNHENVHIYELA